MKLDPDAEWWMVFYLPLAIPLVLLGVIAIVAAAMVWTLLLLPLIQTMACVVETAAGPR